MNRGDRVTDRDRLERDSEGRLRGEVRSERAGTAPRGAGGRGGNNKDDGGTKRTLLFLATIALAILLFLGLQDDINLKNRLRTWDMTNEQGVASLHNAIQELEDINKRKGEVRGVLDKNRLYKDVYMEYSVEKEYLVYVFTGDLEKDKVFTEWVKEHDKDIKIYRISIDDIRTNEEVKSYVKDRDPMILVYNEVERGVKNLEGVIKDERILPEILEYVESLIEEKIQDKQRNKGKRKTYKVSE